MAVLKLGCGECKNTLSLWTHTSSARETSFESTRSDHEDTHRQERGVHTKKLILSSSKSQGPLISNTVDDPPKSYTKRSQRGPPRHQSDRWCPDAINLHSNQKNSRVWAPSTTVRWPRSISVSFSKSKE